MLEDCQRMTPREIAQYRLVNQRIAARRCKTPAEVVTALVAMQAQDYLGALWAVGLRLPDATETVVERAIAERTIVRTWPMRGTLHFVAAADVRWLLELLTPRIIASSARRHAQLELDSAVLARSRKLSTRALQGGKQLTRAAMMKLLDDAGISTAGQRGYHILGRLALEGLICLGPRAGKAQTFTLLDEWVPHARTLDRDEALAELARRYFIGHGPATLQDFVWWTGLKVSDAKRALDSATTSLSRQLVGDVAYWMPRDLPAVRDVARKVYWLPGFDEYLLGYKDRSAVLNLPHAKKIHPGGNGMFLSSMVIAGQVAGTWNRTLKRDAVVITANPFIKLTKAAQGASIVAAERYGKFVGLPVEVRGL
jgi:hypothetical protein